MGRVGSGVEYLFAAGNVAAVFKSAFVLAGDQAGYRKERVREEVEMLKV